MITHNSCYNPGFVNEGKGIYSIARPVTEEEVYNKAKAIISERFLRSVCLGSVSAAGDYFILQFADYEQEVFMVAFLDNQNYVIACKEMFYGTINSAVIYPREVVKMAVYSGASRTPIPVLIER